MNTCQLIVLSVIIAVSAAETAWSGPPANHQIGQLVQDTPEVAEIKRQHAEAYNAIRKLLPNLPVEEQQSHFPQTPQYPQFPQFPQVPEVVTYHPVIVTPSPLQPTASQAPWKGPFADHKLGQNVRETPEVEAARRLHEDVYSKVRSILPELPPQDTISSDLYEPLHVPQFPQVTVPPQHHQEQRVYNHEAADVEAARQAHLRAFQETAALLERLNAEGSSTVAPVVHWTHRPETPAVPSGHLDQAQAIAAILTGLNHY